MAVSSRLTLFLILFAFAVGMTATERCRREHLPSPVQLTDTILTRQFNVENSEIESITVEARCSLPKIKEVRGMSRQCWGISLTSPVDTLNVSLRFGNTDFGDILDRRICILTVTLGEEVLFSDEVFGFHTGADEFNTLAVTLHGRQLTVDGGGRNSRRVCDIMLNRDFTPCGSSVWNIGTMLLSVYSTEVCRPPHIAFASGITREELDRYFARSFDPIEGYWKYFDRTNDPMFARPGGRYTLAVIRDKELNDSTGTYPLATYNIIYIDGAQTMADRWSPMMLKGTLRSTIFEGHYDLTWIDSTFDTITDDINATLAERTLLSLNFPLLKTTIRFSKVPVK